MPGGKSSTVNPDGLIDTNVLVHALMSDDSSDECRAFLEGVRSGSMRAEIHPLVVHELTYTMMRVRVFSSRQAVAEYVRSVLQWPGIVSDVTILDRTLERWGSEAQVGIDPIIRLGGALPNRALSMVFEWASLHQRELMENWRRLHNEEPVERIEPLF